MSVLEARWLGSVPYVAGLELQADLHARRRADVVPDTLLQLEHPHVYTIGRRGVREQVLWDDDALAARGVEVHQADRGGQVTYHGPGQLVGYPIVHLGLRADVIAYLRALEEAVIRTLAAFGVAAGRVGGDAGVWAGDAKIAAVGVRVTRGVAKHGYALNVSPDLSYFAGIVPCGITDRGVTSMLALLGEAPPVQTVAAENARSLADALGRELVVAEAAPA